MPNTTVQNLDPLGRRAMAQRWMRRIEASPFVTTHESLCGLIFDMATGNVYEVTLAAPQVAGSTTEIGQLSSSL
jgi:hypothetical protein